jgi:hypothetical protein
LKVDGDRANAAVSGGSEVERTGHGGSKLKRIWNAVVAVLGVDEADLERAHAVGYRRALEADDVGNRDAQRLSFHEAHETEGRRLVVDLVDAVLTGLSQKASPAATTTREPAIAWLFFSRSCLLRVVDGCFGFGDLVTGLLDGRDRALNRLVELMLSLVGSPPL